MNCFFLLQSDKWDGHRREMQQKKCTKNTHRTESKIETMTINIYSEWRSDRTRHTHIHRCWLVVSILKCIRPFGFWTITSIKEIVATMILKKSFLQAFCTTFSEREEWKRKKKKERKRARGERELKCKHAPTQHNWHNTSFIYLDRLFVAFFPFSLLLIPIRFYYYYLFLHYHLLSESQNQQWSMGFECL